MSTLAELVQDIPQLHITSLSPKPTIVQGQLHGMDFQLRYRAGTAVLTVGGEPMAPLYRAETDYGSEWSSTLSADDVAEVLHQLVPALRRSPRQWAFASISGDAPELCWGQSPEDAYRCLMDSYRLAGLSEPQISDQTHTVDDRIWPSPEPVFEVE